MLRYHTTAYTDPIDAAMALKGVAMFHGCTFRAGVLKDQRGVFIIKDMDYKGGYGRIVQVDDATRIQVAEDLNVIAAYLPKLQSNASLRIPVALKSGITLSIAPATGEPRAFLFDAEDDSDDLFSANTPYGKAAIEFCAKQAENAEGLQLRDAAVVNLVKLALTASYPSLPTKFWDATGAITLDDVDSILLAAIGSTPDFFVSDGRHSGMPASPMESAAT